MSDDAKLDSMMDALVGLKEAVDIGFSGVDKRLNNVETRLTSIEGEVKGIHRWMAHSDARFDALERRKGR